MENNTFEFTSLIAQINGKLRKKLTVLADASEEELKKIALEDERIRELLDGMEVKRVVVVLKKLVNIVT